MKARQYIGFSRECIIEVGLSGSEGRFSTHRVRYGPESSAVRCSLWPHRGSRDNEVDPGVSWRILGDDDVVWVPRRVLEIENRGVRKVQPHRLFAKSPPEEIVACRGHVREVGLVNVKLLRVGCWCVSFDSKATSRRYHLPVALRSVILMGGTSQLRIGTRLLKGSSRHAVGYGGRVVIGTPLLDALYRRIPCRSPGSFPFSKPLHPSAAVARIQKFMSGGISPLSLLGFASNTAWYRCPTVRSATNPQCSMFTDTDRWQQQYW